MKTDANPSVLFALYSTPDAYEALMKDLKQKGMNVREWHFIDVEIPLDNKYDETINYFKHFCMARYWHDRNPLNRIKNNMFLGRIIDKLPYKPIQFGADDWQHDNRHKLLWTLCCPIAYQDTNTENWIETKLEKQNYEKLKTFASEGYEAKIQGIIMDE